MAVNRKLPRLAATATLREHYRIGCLILALSPTCPTFPTLFPIYSRYHHHRHPFPSFHVFFLLRIYLSNYVIQRSFFSKLGFNESFRKGSQFRFALVVHFHRGIFLAPVRFESIQRTELRNANFRSEARRGYAANFARFFSFLFFFLSLLPPSCLAAFPPPKRKRVVVPHSRHK